MDMSVQLPDQSQHITCTMLKRKYWFIYIGYPLRYAGGRINRVDSSQRHFLLLV